MIKVKDDDISAIRNQLSRKLENERKIDTEISNTRLECDSLKHRLNEANDLLDNRERILLLKDEDIRELKC